MSASMDQLVKALLMNSVFMLQVRTRLEAFCHFLLFFQTLRACHTHIGSFRKIFHICIKSACKIEHFLFSNIWGSVG